MCKSQVPHPVTHRSSLAGIPKWATPNTSTNGQRSTNPTTMVKQQIPPKWSTPKEVTPPNQRIPPKWCAPKIGNPSNLVNQKRDSNTAIPPTWAQQSHQNEATSNRSPPQMVNKSLQNGQPQKSVYLENWSTKNNIQTPPLVKKITKMGNLKRFTPQDWSTNPTKMAKMGRSRQESH